VEQWGGQLEQLGGQLERPGGQLERPGGQLDQLGGQLERPGGQLEQLGRQLEELGRHVEQRAGLLAWRHDSGLCADQLRRWVWLGGRQWQQVLHLSPGVIPTHALCTAMEVTVTQRIEG
jgi:hypothetical protein